jgi:hypothetical protein
MAQTQAFSMRESMIYEKCTQAISYHITSRTVAQAMWMKWLKIVKTNGLLRKSKQKAPVFGIIVIAQNNPKGGFRYGNYTANPIRLGSRN